MESRESYCMFILRIPRSLFDIIIGFSLTRKNPYPLDQQKAPKLPISWDVSNTAKLWQPSKCILFPFSEYKMKSVEYIGFNVAFLIIVLMDLVGNTLVVLVIRLTKTMRTPMNMLLLNLAVADMVVAVFVAIQFVIGPTFEHPSGTTGLWLCKFITGGTITWSAAAVSVGNLVAISIER